MNNLLNISNSLLLIVDIQEKLINAQFEKEKIAKNAAILAEAANILKIPTVVSEQYPKGLGSTIIQVKERLSADTKFFEKTSFSCVEEEGFPEFIRIFNKKQIFICGMESHVCVHQTVSGLLTEGYEVHIIQDAITSRKKWEYKTGLQRMINSGAVPTSVEIALFELLKNAKHPDFKAIQNLIK
ncbi:MAG: isochorismatase family protein [Candidatus Gastranaerophilales bacterium]|nr:isochorismatase family protein [Candidatus Gastranaerophilales bacterium]